MIKRAFNRLWNDERGNMLIIAGAAFPMLVGAAGLATDTIQWTLWKRQLQRAADSAAIAGVYQRIQQDQQAAVDAAVANDIAPTKQRMTFVQRTGLTLNAGYPDVDLLENSGDRISRVRVMLETQRSLAFSSMFMTSPPVIRAVATAASVPGGDTYCVIGLDPSAKSTGIEIGGSTDINMGECSMIANSRNTNEAATNTGSGSKVKARSLAAVGGVKYSADWNIKNYYPSSPPLVDPLATLPIPKIPDKCQENISINSTPNSVIDRSTDTTATGDAGKIVCVTGGLNIKGNVTLGAATYVIDGGDISMTATGTSLKCTGCTIILTNSSNAANTGNILLTGGTVDLTAPSAEGEPYRGIAIYQDRLATDDGKKGQNKITGNSSSGVVGAIYMPNRSLLYNGGGKISATCVQLIGKRVEFSGSSNIKLSSECGAEGLPNLGAGRVVRLVA